MEPSANCKTLSPHDIYIQAERFRVDLTKEPYLIPLLKEAALTPLPPNWTELIHESDESGAGEQREDAEEFTQRQEHPKKRYRNDLTNEVQDMHPADKYFARQIKELRREARDEQQEEPTEPAITGGWMEFETLDAADGVMKKYYYDFVSETLQEAHPKLPLRDRVHGNMPQADPHVFEQADHLHKLSMMKKLDELEIMCFHAWWTERTQQTTKKSLVHIYFSIPTKHFQVVLEDTENVFTISHIVNHTNGKVLECWDLYVGARIMILGRLTTLMQASMLTSQWLDMHHKALQKQKEQLQTELLKYDMHDCHGRKALKRIDCANPHRSAPGTSLRQLRNDIDDLKHKLSKYRPDVTRRICGSA
ncbi:TPA: hypothetical protein N0F65_011073 [Lagenidium giganteum]|uniref:Uncharacterized protein n=1 Tax=Lagenidium giganteum TaxID=4803 RepID=A0AAV2ZF60_9STRA|nr:TPA: hypothetical protein N0F65_011073 [Lagenidium giganteum]